MMNALAFACLASAATATQVGVSWSATSYNDISALEAGDEVVFTYSSSHDVYQFNDKAAYDACDFNNATLLGDTRDSPYTFVMDGSESTVYLGCSKGSHCSRSGQEIALSLASKVTKRTQVGVSWSATSYDDISDLAVGDDVLFSYSSSHDVYQFNDKAAFDACDFGSATLLGDTRDSPFSYVMDGSESTVYLGCSKGSHCSRSGQKVALSLAGKVTKRAQVGVSWSATSYSDIENLDIGDEVLFTYSSSHDVYKFDDKAAFDACDFGSATLLGDTRDSPFSFVMDGSESTAYLGCSKGSHCSRSGQKVAVSLAGASKRAQVGVSWSATSYSDISALEAGDEVVFTYSSSHDVYQFNDKAAFDACDFGSATLLGDTRDSPYSYVMDGSESTVYLGCSKGSHCSRSGQKVALNLV